MKDSEALIDFEPMVVGSLLTQGGNVIVVFPQQPCFSRAVEMGEELNVPFYKCELQIQNGRIVTSNEKLPFEADVFELRYHQGSRRCSLPIDLDVAGPVELRIGPDEMPEVVIVGDRAVLVLDEIVGFKQYKKS